MLKRKVLQHTQLAFPVTQNFKTWYLNTTNEREKQCCFHIQESTLQQSSGMSSDTMFYGFYLNTTNESGKQCCFHIQESTLQQGLRFFMTSMGQLSCPQESFQDIVLNHRKLPGQNYEGKKTKLMHTESSIQIHFKIGKQKFKVKECNKKMKGFC